MLFYLLRKINLRSVIKLYKRCDKLAAKAESRLSVINLKYGLIKRLVNVFHFW